MPPQELERLHELRASHILDSASSQAMDALVDSARKLFDVPVCLISLIDEDRLWMKAVSGMPNADVPRDIAFCSHAIMGDDLFVVEDAAADPRFAENPFVLGDASIRFYAGAPLTVRPGVALGSFCVTDTRPRTMTKDEGVLLRQLATVALALIESHRIAVDSMALVREAEAARLLADEQSRVLRLRETQFRQTEALAKMGGWEIDLSQGTLSWSDEIYRIGEVPLDTPLTIELGLSLYPEPDRTRMKTMLARALEDGISDDEEFVIRTTSGKLKWVRCGCNVETIDGVPTRIFGMFQDISEQREAANELWYAANHDALTGLANRASFQRHLGEAFMLSGGPSAKAIGEGEDDKTGIAILAIDVDCLKEINDTLGHDAGDAMLQTVAARLADAFDADALVARIGGDEFCVTFKDRVSACELNRRARIMIGTIQRPLPFHDDVVTPRVSIGGAVAAASDTAETLRQKADLALYESKRTGRGGYAEFRDDMRSAILNRISTLRKVDDALTEGRIIPHYQPIVRLDSGKVVGFEALARMRNRDGQIVAAGAFQEALQEPRTAHRLTTQMLKAVAADMRSWLDQGQQFQHVSINVTSADFQAGDIRDRILDAFGQHDVPLKHAVLEVTETVFLNGHEAAVVKAVEGLRKDGMLIALDDFGTGFASLTHLRSLPVDIIKVDKSFIDGMLVEATSGPIVETLIDLARKLGLRIVAEGIETSSQADHLRELGCVLGQGYFFARPSSAEVTTGLLQRQLRRDGAIPCGGNRRRTMRIAV